MFDERGPGPDPIDVGADQTGQEKNEANQQVTPATEAKQSGNVAVGKTEVRQVNKESIIDAAPGLEVSNLKVEENFELPKGIEEQAKAEVAQEDQVAGPAFQSGKTTEQLLDEGRQQIEYWQGQAESLRAALQGAENQIQKKDLQKQLETAEKNLNFWQEYEKTSQSMLDANSKSEASASPQSPEVSSNETVEPQKAESSNNEGSTQNEKSPAIPRQPEVYSGKGSEFQKIIDQNKTPEERLQSARENLSFLQKAGLKPVLEGAEAKFYDSEGNKVEINDLADKLGGVENAREALLGLSELVDIYFAKPELFSRTETKEAVPDEKKEKAQRNPLSTFRSWGQAAKDRLTNAWRNFTDYSRSPVLNWYKEASNKFVGWQERVSNNYNERKRILGEKLNAIKENASSTLESFKDLFRWESINISDRIDLLFNDPDGEALKKEKARLEHNKSVNEALKDFVERLNRSKTEAELQQENSQLKTLLAERDKQIAELKSKLANNESKQAELRAADAKPFDWLKIEQEQEIPYVEPGALADTVEEVDSSVAPRTISLDQPGPEAASKTD
ncbi:hypothetical protein KC644_03105 [Candidatus Berkelbacteria bacterium]|nr:hypothetical protein [Candidatus Berkelbacteria bacterium]